ncbi:hypothetical protein [Acidianus sp. HS-5]|uniref:hypothetical protein n=1 Tax=Acidianus sp. HS-5 TaxID=2886040 RepID=UPI001F46187B|nr:hypothetical protein [Acidianus sp. HS-5]
MKHHNHHIISGGKFIQLVPTTKYYNYVGYNETRLIYCNLWYFNIRGSEVNVTTTPTDMTIISNQSILAIGYIVPGYYDEISVDYSYNLQGAFGVFLKIFCNMSSCRQYDMLNSIVIAFYKPPTAQPPDAVFCYNVTFPVIINGTESNVEFGVYKSPVHIFYIPYTPLFGNVTLFVNCFTENAGYYKPYFIGIFNHAAVSTEKNAVAVAVVYNLFVIQSHKVPTPHIPVVLRNGVLTFNGTSYVAKNSMIEMSEALNPINVESKCNDSMTYVKSIFNVTRIEFHINSGENFLGAKIVTSNSTLYLFLYSSIKKSSSCIVYIPLIVNGKTEVMKFYEIKCGNISYLYPQCNIEGVVRINFIALEKYFHLDCIKGTAIGDVYPGSYINFTMSYQEVTPKETSIIVNSEIPFYYINGVKYYTNKTYEVSVPALVCIPNNLTSNLTRYILRSVNVDGVTMPNKFILPCGCYNITTNYLIQYYICIILPNGTVKGWYNASSVVIIPKEIEVNGVTYVLNGSNEFIILHTGVYKPCYVVETSSTTTPPTSTTSTTTSTITTSSTTSTSSTAATNSTSTAITSTTPTSTTSPSISINTSYLPIMIVIIAAIAVGGIIILKRR